MTAQDLFDKIDALVEKELASLEGAAKANYMARRSAILAAARDLWDKAAVAPKKDAVIGNIVYVSKAEAAKYGRLERLNDLVKAEANIGALADISAIEVHGVKVYETQYNGYAWAYQQGYTLPITGGAKVQLVAKALYSDFYGKAFDETVREHLGKYADDIIGAATRGLNQGHAYSKIAQAITDTTDRAYSRALITARTEAGRIQSQAYLDGLALLDEVGAEYGKMWQSTIDSRTRADHVTMDGKDADKDGVFHLPSGATGPAPRMTGVAGDDIQCRCTSITVINGERPSQRRIRGEGIVPYETFAQRLDRNGNIPLNEIRKARKAK